MAPSGELATTSSRPVCRPVRTSVTGNDTGDRYDYYRLDINNAARSVLTSVTIGSGVTSIGNAVFTGANVIDLTVIGNGQFDYSKLPYSTVKNLTVTGTAVTSGAFSSFTALEGVTIDDTVESVGANAFSGGSEILFAVFENGDTVIDTNAFGDYKPIIVGYDPSTAKSFASNNEMLFIASCVYKTPKK